MFKNLNLASIISIIIIGLFVGVVFVYADWIAPLNSPPTCVAGNPGCDAPINVGSIYQEKIGNFGVFSLTTRGILLNPILDVMAPNCNSNKKGFIYFSDTQNKHFLCNGSSWTDYQGPAGATGATGATGPAGSSADHGKQRFTANGTFTVPAGVTKLWVSMSGGGGGGGGGAGAGGSYCGGAGGGGAHAVIAQEVSVSPNELISVTVGAGGSGVTNGGIIGADGSAGIGSLFGSYILTPGGGGGDGCSSGSNGGSAGGSGGSVGERQWGSSRGSDGGSSIFGSEGHSGGSAGGYGGGGGGGMSGLGSYFSGSGTPGFVLVEW